MNNFIPKFDCQDFVHGQQGREDRLRVLPTTLDSLGIIYCSDIQTCVWPTYKRLLVVDPFWSQWYYWFWSQAMRLIKLSPYLSPRIARVQYINLQTILSGRGYLLKSSFNDHLRQQSLVLSFLLLHVHCKQLNDSRFEQFVCTHYYGSNLSTSSLKNAIDVMQSVSYQPI